MAAGRPSHWQANPDLLQATAQKGRQGKEEKAREDWRVVPLWQSQRASACTFEGSDAAGRRSAGERPERACVLRRAGPLTVERLLSIEARSAARPGQGLRPPQACMYASPRGVSSKMSCDHRKCCCAVSQARIDPSRRRRAQHQGASVGGRGAGGARSAKRMLKKASQCKELFEPETNKQGCE